MRPAKIAAALLGLACAAAMAAPAPVFAQSEAGKADVARSDVQAFLLARDRLGEKLRAECGDAPPLSDLSISPGTVDGLPGSVAVVEATTCVMGNGGADIVQVVQKLPSGALATLPIDDAQGPPDLFAGRLSTPRLEIRDHALVRWFVKGVNGEKFAQGATPTKREIRYRWAGDRFVVDSVKDIPDPG